MYLITDEAVTNSGLVCDGFEPFLDEIGQHMLPLDQLVPGVPGAFYARVAGAGHHARDIQRDCFAVGQQLVLVPEPDNPADANAVRVVAVDGSEMRVGGYLPADLVADVPDALRRDGGNAIVVQTYSKGGQRVGLRIVGTFGVPLDVRSVDK